MWTNTAARRRRGPEAPPRKNFPAKRIAIVVAALASGFGPVLAQDTWLGGIGNWYGPWLGNTLDGTISTVPTPTTNWLCLYCLPGPGDSVNIGVLFGAPIGPVNGTAILNMPTTVALVALGVGAAGALDVEGTTLNVTNSVLLGTASGGVGTLSISGGGIVNITSATVGELSGVGSVTVDGAGSRLNATGGLLLGLPVTGFLFPVISSGSAGTLTVQNGAQANVAGVQVFVGALTVQSGALLASTDDVVGALNGNVGSGLPFGSGTATVNGPGSRWVDNSLTVGSGGNGTLTIENGGVVNTSGGSSVAVAVGFDGNPLVGGGTVLVNGAGSLWNTGSLAIGVGDGGFGFLTVSKGGVVDSGSTVVGGGAPCCFPLALSIGMLTVQDRGTFAGGALSVGFGLGSGAVIVEGAGSSLSLSGDLTLYNGSLSVSGGAQVTDANASVGLGNSSDVLVDGASWNTTGTLDIGTFGLDDTGAVTVENGGLLTAGDTVVGATSFPTGTGIGNVLINGADWITVGTLDIGVGGTGTVTVENDSLFIAGSTIVGPTGSLVDDPSMILINGDFTLDPGGVLTLDIAGIGQHGQLDISGLGTFAGTIDINFIDGFVPQAGETFDLIEAQGGANFAGATFNVDGAPAGPSFTESFQNGEFQFADTPEPASLYLFATVLLAFLIGAWRAKSRRRRPS